MTMSIVFSFGYFPVLIRFPKLMQQFKTLRRASKAADGPATRNSPSCSRNGGQILSGAGGIAFGLSN